MKKTILLIFVFVLSISGVCFAAESEPLTEKETETKEYAIEQVLETPKEDAQSPLEGIDAADVEALLDDGETSDGFSLPDAISSINESGFDIRKIFDLIADMVDIASNEGGRTTAGNIIRAVGSLVSAIINNDELSVNDANRELARELIMDENSLSQLSDGMVLDIYQATRDALHERGIIIQE